MPEEAVKRQLRRAKGAAIEKCREMGYQILVSDNSLFCFLAMRRHETRLIKVIIDEFKDRDIKLIRGFEPAGPCTKEIWRRDESGHFEIREIR